MSARAPTPDLEELAARQLADLLGGVASGSPLQIDSSSDICDTLELLVPQALSRTHSEWETESIDGFFFARAVKLDDASAELIGTCILISDQAVTPFALDLGLASDGRLRPFRIRLGEPGGGSLGISGPGCNSPAAAALLAGVGERVGQIVWIYDVSFQ